MRCKKREDREKKKRLTVLTQDSTGSTKAVCSSLSEQTFPALPHAYIVFAVGVSSIQVTHGKGSSHCKMASIVFHVVNQDGYP